MDKFLTDDTFDIFLQAIKTADKPVFLAIGSKTCVVCKTVGPLFVKLSERFADKGIFLRCPGDENPRVKEKLGVLSFPTLLAFKNGREFSRITEIKSPSELVAWMEAAF